MLAACSGEKPRPVAAKPGTFALQPVAATQQVAQAPARVPEPAARSEPAPVQRAPELLLVPNAGFVEPARPAASPPEPAKPAVPAKAEAPEPATQVAALVPPPARPAMPIRVVSRVEPDFPRTAFQARVERGLVKARMTLDGSGNVTRVDIVDAMPRRVFDNAVAVALAQWKFNDGAAGRTYDTEVVFQR